MMSIAKQATLYALREQMKHIDTEHKAMLTIILPHQPFITPVACASQEMERYVLKLERYAFSPTNIYEIWTWEGEFVCCVNKEEEQRFLRHCTEGNEGRGA